jgi:DNA repair protein RecO (recombination protein O)
MKRIELQPAYVLHRRPYRETSCLLELFTLDHGRLSVIAKGVRKPRSATSGLLQAFTPVLVSWSGKGELMTMIHIEAHGTAAQLRGDCLFAGLYLNELLMCLLQKWDAHPVIHTLYEKTLDALQSDTLEEKILRTFEKGVLEELGYGLLPKQHATLERTFHPDKFYRFTPDHGLLLSEIEDPSLPTLFSGKSLLAIAREEWETPDALRDAKRLMRFVLAPLLGAREIYSRKLFT